MRVEKFYLVEIMADLNKRLEGKSDKILFGFRQKVSPDRLNDFITVIIPRLDGRVQQSGSATIDIACRNKANGMENVPRLQELADSVTSLFPITGKRYALTSPSIVLKGEDGTGFSHWLVMARLKVNVTDSHIY